MAANAYLYFFGLALIQSAAVDYNNMFNAENQIAGNTTQTMYNHKIILGSIATIALLATAFLFKWYYPFIGLLISTMFYGVTRPIYRSFIFSHQLFAIAGVAILVASFFWQ